MENLKKLTIAWSKLASTGARPAGEKAGMTRETFSRVLNNRRQLQNDEAQQLAVVLGLGAEGFLGHRIESNLCRFLSDLKDLGEAGVQLHFIAHLRSSKELRGGVVLQRYSLALATHGKTQRLMVLRMASEKHDQMVAEWELPPLPNVEVDTAVLPLLSDISTELKQEEWTEFMSVYNRARAALQPGYDKKTDEAEVVHAQAVVELAKWLARTLVRVLSVTDAGALTGSMARRVRATDLSKLAADESVLAPWPSKGKELAKTRVLTPLTNEYRPFHAAGLTEAGAPVFVYMTVISEVVGVRIPDQVREANGYVIVLASESQSSDMRSSVAFEGPVELLVPALQDESLNQAIATESVSGMSFLKYLAAAVPDSKKLKKKQ